MRTRMFKSGNSEAIRIPKSLGFRTPSREISIERQGDSLLIRPLSRPPLSDVLELFAAFPAGFMSEGRERNEERERNWG